MATVTLPISGQVLELHEPTFAEELHLVSQGADNLEELMYAKCAVIVPAISREQIGALAREDGRALIVAVGRIWDGRPEEQEAPFGNGSVTPSTVSVGLDSNSTS